MFLLYRMNHFIIMIEWFYSVELCVRMGATPEWSRRLAQRAAGGFVSSARAISRRGVTGPKGVPVAIL